MKKLRIGLAPAFCCLFAGLLLLQPQVSVDAVRSGLQLCAGALLPALFPFLVLTRLWIALGYAHRLSLRLRRWMACLFHLPGEAASVLLLGAVSGYPMGTVTAVQLYEDRQLSQEAAEQCLLFCNNGGPAFFVGVLGVTVFHDLRIGLLLWAIHLTAALLLGLCFRPRQRLASISPADSASPAPAFLPALTQAIAEAGSTMLQVCAYLLFFSVLTTQIRALVPTRSFPLELLLASLELAGGLHSLQAMVESPSLLFLLCAGLTAWGGLCIHCQSLNVLSATSLSIRPYLFGKALHSILSMALASLLLPALPFFSQTTAPGLPLLWGLVLCGLLILVAKTGTGKSAFNTV